MTAPNKSADNAYQDHSGVSTASFANPYDALIAATGNDAKELQSRYALHRSTRNAAQKAKLLDPAFTGPVIDPILLRLTDPSVEPGYVDPRHCLVFWGRPTEAIKRIISRVQQDLLSVAPNLWVMPQDCLHITALEMTHSKTDAEIRDLVTKMHERIPTIATYTYDHRARLIKPMIGFDASALALSFVPAAGEASEGERPTKDDGFSYHHLRRDLYSLCQETGASVDSRYVVPSSHLTIGRFIYTKDFTDASGRYDRHRMEVFIDKIESINQWLQAEFWPDQNGGRVPAEADWIVGQEQGLVCRKGTLWYGGGETVHQGEGF